MARKRNHTSHDDQSTSGNDEVTGSTPEGVKPIGDSSPESTVVDTAHTDFASSASANSSGTMMELEWCLNRLSAHIQALDDHYRISVPVVQRFTSERADQLWLTLREFPLIRLAQQDRSIDDEAIEDGLCIQQLFPELDLLPLAHLHFWYTEYQAKCRYTDPPHGSRSPGFLFFILGQLASDQTLQRDSPIEAGTLVALAFLKGKNAEQAMRFGMNCFEFHRNLRSLAACASSIHLRILSSVDYSSPEADSAGAV